VPKVSFTVGGRKMLCFNLIASFKLLMTKGKFVDKEIFEFSCESFVVCG
jgi:hypothetical protein